MIREMRIRNYNPRTIKTYVSLLSQLSRYYNSSTMILVSNEDRYFQRLQRIHTKVEIKNSEFYALQTYDSGSLVENEGDWGFILSNICMVRWPGKTAQRRRQAFGDRWRIVLALSVGASFCLESFWFVFLFMSEQRGDPAQAGEKNEQ